MEEYIESAPVPDTSDAVPAGFGRNARMRIRWGMPAATVSMALVAALCLHGPAAQTSSASKTSGSTAISLRGSGLKTSQNIKLAGSSLGGIHGAVNVYEGPGGGVEFWIDFANGTMTVAVGEGVGVGGNAVIGAYAAGSEPQPGTYAFASASLNAGTVSSSNISGTYSLSDGTFSGSVSGTVLGRSITFSSDGITQTNVSVMANSSALSAGWTAAVGLKQVFSFDYQDFLNDIWNSILDGIKSSIELITGDQFDGLTSPEPNGDDDSTTSSDTTDDSASDLADAASSDSDTTTSDDSGNYTDTIGEGDYNADE